jgi:tRNA(adenine34) deaminase
MNDAQKWMEQAVLCAQTAENDNEVPVGCVAVLNEQIIGYGWNQNITQCDPTAHAEIMAIRKAGQYQKNHRFQHCHYHYHRRLPLHRPHHFQENLQYAS